MRIGSILLFKNGLCYQSYNWNMLRPLGDLQNAVDFLEKYKIDDISIIRPIRGTEDENSLSNDIKKINNLKSSTPISFGGGLGNLNSLNALHSLPIERVILSSSFVERNNSFIENIECFYGKQAIQCCLPVRIINNKLHVFYSKNMVFVELNKKIIDFVGRYSNELIVYDIENEGVIDAFDFNLLNNLEFDYSRIVISGGVGPNSIKQAKELGIASVSIENRVLHSEYSVKGMR